MKLSKKFLPSSLKKPFQKKEAGSAPGTLTHIGIKKLDKVIIDIHDYDNHHLDIQRIENISECDPYVNTPNPTWVQVKGLHDIVLLKELWEKFHFHPLIQEDILNTTQRAKIEDYGEQIFIVLKMLYMEDGVLEQEQVSIVFTDKFIFSFQESERKIFAPIKDRLAVTNTRMRKGGPDYMAYALTDIIIDYYFSVLEEMNNEIEEIEETLWLDTNSDALPSIHKVRRQLLQFRKSVWPLRENINSLVRDESKLIHKETRLFLRDVADHTFQIVDNLDSNREMISSLHDMHQTNISNKMNEVMKVLTIIATIFIPLTFVAGIYGMNFEYMPELSWHYSYPVAWVVMILMTIGMLIFFKKRKWL